MEKKGPIGGGGSNPKPKDKTLNKSSRYVGDYQKKSLIERTIDHKNFKTFLSLIPLFSLFITVFCTNYYYFFNDNYSKYYTLISYCNGFSLASLPAYFYIVYKYKFCYYSKFAIWGLLTYILINITWFFLDLFFDFEPGLYSNIFEALSITIFLALSLFYVITNNNKNET